MNRIWVLVSLSEELRCVDDVGTKQRRRRASADDGDDDDDDDDVNRQRTRSICDEWTTRERTDDENGQGCDDDG